MIVVIAFLFLEKSFKNLAKEPKYHPLCEEWNPVRQCPKDILVFFGFRGPADIIGSVYWEVGSEH
jgi:hypothetical protein